MAISPYRVAPDEPILNAVLYGDPGCGKTTLAASCQDHPAMGDVLFANIEGGLLSISHRKDIHAVDITKTKDLEDLYWELKKGQYDSVRTCVIDSATELQTMNLEEIVNAAMKKAEATGGPKQSRSGNVRTRDDIWQDDYGKSTVQLKRIFRWFKDLQIHVIITALAKYVYPKVGRDVDLSQIDPLAVLPTLTAKLGSSLTGYMDFVWYMRYDPESKTYQALTQRDSIYFAKTRGLLFAKAIPEVMELKADQPNKLMMPEIYDEFCRTQAGGKPRKKKV